MVARWLIAAGASGLMFLCAAQAIPRQKNFAAERESAAPPVPAPTEIIDEIVFVGLRHISPEAVRAQITLRREETLIPGRVEADIRRLARLGWFGEIFAEAESARNVSSRDDVPPRVRLIFHLEEHPYLTGVRYSGSRLLSSAQIEKLLSDEHLAPRLGEPANLAMLHHAANAIRGALEELGHPQAQVNVAMENLPSGTVRARFDIRDGPHVPVGQIVFTGTPGVPTKILRRQMRRISPGVLFSDLRGKDAYTKEGFEEDRRQLLTYYRNHGYPEARIGNASVSQQQITSLRWLPWPHRAISTRLLISVPVESGARYSVSDVSAASKLLAVSGSHAQKLLAAAHGETAKAYSADSIENLRCTWQAVIQPNSEALNPESFHDVEVNQNFDGESHSVGLHFDLGPRPPVLIRRIEIQGLHRFTDRFVRRRILLKEGQPLDNLALELGLKRLARTGYFRPVNKEDVIIQTDEASRTADVILHLHEIGKQRFSFLGSTGQFGSTLGIAYTLFNLFDQDELLATELDGGPETLQLLIGFAKQGFLGSRGSLAISAFTMLVRPNFAGSTKGPFYSSETQGVNAGWTYAVANTDALGINYGLSHTNTEYALPLPTNSVGVTSSNVSASTSSHSLGVGWTRDATAEHFVFSDSFSGSFLGGKENLLRSSEEYAHIFPDKLFDSQNAWAFRTSLAGVGSYSGNMPLYARLFPSDEYVRGLRTGDLGPYAINSTVNSAGVAQYSAAPAGANLITAANLEYRVPLTGGTQATGFFDLGSGRLLPNWLGSSRPSLAAATNGLLHGSTGVQLQWTVPGVGVPVRGYYAVNVLRLSRFLTLPDGSLFHARNRVSSFGWGLGNLF